MGGGGGGGGGRSYIFKGVQLLIPMETYRTCDFPGGPDTLPPPLDLCMLSCQILTIMELSLTQASR